MVVVLVLHVEVVAISFNGFLVWQQLVVCRLLVVETYIRLISSSLMVDLQGQQFLHIVYQLFRLLRKVVQYFSKTEKSHKF